MTYFSNVPADLNMGNIWAIYNKDDGPIRSCKYVVQIGIPRLLTTGVLLGSNTAPFGDAGAISGTWRDIPYLCEATEFPGRGVMFETVRHYGPTHKLPFNSTYEDLNMTFVCRSRSMERRLFDDWQAAINPTDTYNFNYRDDYATQINMFQLDDTNNPSYSFTLFDAFPIMVSAQPVTFTDDNFQRVTVTFTFTKWKRRGIDYSDSIIGGI